VLILSEEADQFDLPETDEDLVENVVEEEALEDEKVGNIHEEVIEIASSLEHEQFFLVAEEE